jgi:hypothetical protein
VTITPLGAADKTVSMNIMILGWGKIKESNIHKDKYLFYKESAKQ